MPYSTLGPLVLSMEGDAYPGDSEPPTLIGVVSWSGSCGDYNFPEVYGRVSDVLDWIEEKMREEL